MAATPCCSCPGGRGNVSRRQLLGGSARLSTGVAGRRNLRRHDVHLLQHLLARCARAEDDAAGMAVPDRRVHGERDLGDPFRRHAGLQCRRADRLRSGADGRLAARCDRRDDAWIFRVLGAVATRDRHRRCRRRRRHRLDALHGHAGPHRSRHDQVGRNAGDGLACHRHGPGIGGDDRIPPARKLPRHRCGSRAPHPGHLRPAFHGDGRGATSSPTRPSWSRASRPTRRSWLSPSPD